MLLVAIVGVMWLVEIINSLDSYRLNADGGIHPRDLGQVWEVFTSPFLHGSWGHLIANTIPFVFMGVIIALHGAALTLDTEIPDRSRRVHAPRSTPPRSPALTGPRHAGMVTKLRRVRNGKYQCDPP